MQTYIVFVTCPNPDVAASIARTLVEERLAACGNLVPGIRSIYRWKGKIEQETETLLLLKTDAEAYPHVQSRVQALHPYEVPEILAVPVEHGLPAYLNWITDSLGEESQDI